MRVPTNQYAFSIEPYRLIEMIWPNVWGGQFGGNTYWAPLMRIARRLPEDLGAIALSGWIDFVLACQCSRFERASLAGVAFVDHRS